MNKKADIDLISAFYMEPKEIVDYFQSKGLKPSFNWHEVYEQAHSKAFTVAKMTNIDLLNDTQNMLSTAIKEGWSAGHFKKEASNLFAKKGWVGFKEVTNSSTGELQKVELGTPRRIKRIFDSNMASAYSIGRYKQQLEDVDIAPYFQYMCILDNHTRAEHSALHGKVFRYDDPLFSSLYPPNGWGCRCFVRSLSQFDLDKKGLKIESSNGKLRAIETLVGGEPKELTVFDFKLEGRNFTLKPDAGWSNNNAIQAWGIDVLAYSKIKDLPQGVKDKFISEMARNPHNKNVYEYFVNHFIKNKMINKNIIKEIPLTWISADLLKTISQEKVIPKTPVVVMQDERIGHTLGKKVTKDELIGVYDIINKPDEIFYDYTRKGLVGLVYVKNLKNNMCTKVCVSLSSRKIKTPINYISTVGKVDRRSLNDKKLYKKIE